MGTNKSEYRDLTDMEERVAAELKARFEPIRNTNTHYCCYRQLELVIRQIGLVIAYGDKRFNHMVFESACGLSDNH